jgi:hypothetical protein
LGLSQSKVNSKAFVLLALRRELGLDGARILFFGKMAVRRNNQQIPERVSDSAQG